MFNYSDLKKTRVYQEAKQELQKTAQAGDLLENYQVIWLRLGADIDSCA